MKLFEVSEGEVKFPIFCKCDEPCNMVYKFSS
jgi:hypothetical protein